MDAKSPEVSGSITLNKQIDFPRILSEAKSFKDIKIAVADEIKRLKQNGITRIGFVSGPLRYKNSNISEEAESDEKAMRETIKRLQQKHGIPVFGSTSIFDVGVWDRLGEAKKLKNKSLSKEQREELQKEIHLKMNEMFIGIMEGGVTDIFMMEGWEPRDGCQAEYAVSAAPNSGIKIHDYKNNFE